MARPICIDPGHGGHDPGAIGPTGLRESEVVLDVANRIVSLLDERGHSVLMTRERDSFVGLRERAKVANHASSRIFVSLHCNAFTDPDANGLEVWHWDGSRLGEMLAGHIQSRLVDALGWRDRGVKPTHVFQVLNHTRMPAVLVELGFLSSPDEEAQLSSDSVRQTIADEIVRAIEDYIEEAESE